MFDFLPFLTVIVGFITSFILGRFTIPFLRKLKFGQTIREEGPKWHEGKSGTPTMGGVIIFGGIVAAMIISTIFTFITSGRLSIEFKDSTRTAHWIAAFGLAVGMGLIGFVDDFIKVVKKRNLGLTARQKTFAQLIVSATYLLALLFSGMNSTYIPFIGNVNLLSGVGLIFWPIALLFIYGFTNAVNLTDGIDGLASSVTLVVCCAFMIIGGYTNFNGVNMLAAAGAGACGGFIMWNAHPAKVFMGDTGSMFLGGLVVGLSFAVGRPILLIVIGIIYLIEAFSVMIQVAYFKKTKKRIFKMTPIHHHFEMCNWSEEKIVLVFSIVTLIGSVIGILPVILDK
jgi:phospho-N-acetylmuramoyl-pentapeptide-transferase